MDASPAARPAAPAAPPTKAGSTPAAPPTKAGSTPAAPLPSALGAELRQSAALRQSAIRAWLRDFRRAA